MTDTELIRSGVMKINWVKDFMPTLEGIRKRFEVERPFEGKRVTVSVHMEAKTAYLCLVLKSGGADVRATGCNPLSTQDDVVAGLQSMGIPVYAKHGATNEEYEAHLVEALSHKPHLIIDDGGDLVALLTGSHKELAENLIGGCEETTTGVHRLKSKAAAGTLPWPMMNVNDAKCKHYYDNKYGTGQSVWDGIMHTTNLLVAGKTVVIAGYGYCGRGVAMRAKGMGADVVVTECNAVKALEAVMDGYRVMTMDDAASIGDIFVTTTGCRDIITRRHMEKMKNNAFLSNAGHFDVEINKNDLMDLSVEKYQRRENIEGYVLKDGRTLNLLGEGRLVNLAAGNGHPAEIMDMSFSVQALAMEYLLKNGESLAPGLYSVPDSIDEEVSAVKLAAMGITIDSLTKEQQEYMDQ